MSKMTEWQWRRGVEDAVVLFVGICFIIIIGSGAFYACSYLLANGMQFWRSLK